MSHAKPSWRDHLRYRFENTLARGPIAIILWLALVSGLIVLAAALILKLFAIPQDPNDPSSTFDLFEGLWLGLMHAIDAGNLAGDSGWWLRAVMAVVTLAGIFLVSILIGTIATGLEARLDDLRKGRSRVIESNHTLILGWSSKVFTIVGELITANQNQQRPCIVILADRDKVEMEDEIKAKFPQTGNTRVICRRGDPLDLDDLEVAAPHSARSIIVLAQEEQYPGQNPDIYVIKSVLALTNNPERKTTPYHIVAEIHDRRNLEAAALVGGSDAVFVLGSELIAKVTAQTCRQSGLSVVYTELLNFEGEEIYFKAEPGLVGRSYREALSSYERSAVMGLLHADGSVQLNPPASTILRADDRIIAISEDDDRIILGARSGTVDAGALVSPAARSATPEKTLILGWNPKAATVIRELDNYVAAGSELLVLCQGEDVASQIDTLAAELQHLRLRFQPGDITHRGTLDSLSVTTFDHIIVVSYSQLPVQEADAMTLIALLHLRAIAEQQQTDLSIVSEMMDLRNRTLAQVAKADDFIVSDQLVSLMLAQLSENRALHSVFRQLFSADGAEIYLRPMADYVHTEQELDFHTLIEAASRRGETALGYRLAHDGQDKEKSFGVRLNPAKSTRRRFHRDDQLIVLADV